MRANGLIVFVPKYGIEGPVYLEPTAAAPSSSAPAAAPAADSAGAFVYDEEHQRVSSRDGSVQYRVFDKCAVRIVVEEGAGNRRQLVLQLVPRGELPAGEVMDG